MTEQDKIVLLEDNHRLRAELDQLRKDFEFEIRERNAAICERDAAILERDEARVDQRLIDELWDRRTEMTDMNEQIKRLRKERDEARRWICQAGDMSLKFAKQLALLRGWDCFNDEADANNKAFREGTLQ